MSKFSSFCGHVIGNKALVIGALLCASSPGALAAAEKGKVEDTSYRRLKISLHDSANALLSSGYEDLPYTFPIGAEATCQFSHGFKKVTLLCLANDDFQILYVDEVSCVTLTPETKSIKVVDTESGKVFYVRWSCDTGETA